jgi:energy-coupling factor transporter ATP-binding protein EcfA2
MRLEAVGKRYGLRQPWVVRDVSVDVAGGRLIRVEGPNGSGKSTLLRVVAGVTTASRGRVSGRPHTGYVPERFPGGLPFSGQEYLLHMARVHGLRGDAGRRRVDEWLERLGAAGWGGAPQPERRDDVIIIELACVEAAGLVRLTDLPGVLSCAPAGVAGRVQLRVAQRQSDAVLRQVLGWDGVHVAGVRQP